VNFKYRCCLSCLSQAGEKFASFEKLDRGLVSLKNGHTCQIEGICTVHIKLFDEMVRELKDVRYIPQLKKNLILVGALEAQDLEGLLEKVFSRCLVARWWF